MLGHDIAAGFVYLGVLFFLLPFLFSAFLAWSRGKSIVMSLIFTIIFSWIAPFALFLLPVEKDNANVEGD